MLYLKRVASTVVYVKPHPGDGLENNLFGIETAYRSAKGWPARVNVLDIDYYDDDKARDQSHDVDWKGTPIQKFVDPLVPENVPV